MQDPPSTVGRPSSKISDNFFETTREAKMTFLIQPPGPLGTRICSFGPGDISNKAATPVYDKNL